MLEPLSQMKPTDLAPELLSPSQQVEFPGRTAALPFQTVVRTIEKDKPFLSSGQASSVNRMEPQRSDIAILHRLFPLGAVRSGDKPVLVGSDEMTGFVNDGFSSVLIGGPGPQGNAEANSGSVGGRAIARISESLGKPPIPFDDDDLAQLVNVVGLAGESNPTSDVAVVQDVLLRSRWGRRFLWWDREQQVADQPVVEQPLDKVLRSERSQGPY